MRDAEVSMEKMGAARKDIIGTFIENEVDPQEALSLLSGMLVQIYRDMVQNNSRDNFVSIMGQCYDTFQLIEAEPEGSVH